MNNIYEINDWTKGKPKRSGSYIVKSKKGTVGRDDYSIEKGVWWKIEKGVWWNYEVEYYSPSSYREL